MFDKDKYWKNRKENKRGQGEIPKPKPQKTETPTTATIGFDNDGAMVIKNRAYRRQPLRLNKKSSQLRKRKKRK